MILNYSPCLTAVCTPCPPNTDGCSGGIITVSPGYWRISPYSTALLACPWPHACQGGDGSNITTPIATTSRRRLSPIHALTDASAGCAPGYIGPLCAICADHYYFASTTTTCEACGNNGAGQFSLMIVIPLLLVVALFGTVVSFVKYGHKLVAKEGVDEFVDMAGGADVESEHNEEEEAGGNTAHVSAPVGNSTISRMQKNSTTGRATHGNYNINRVSNSRLGVVSSLCRGVWRRLKDVWKRVNSMFRVLSPIINIGSAVVSFVISLDPDLLLPIVKIMTTAYQIVSNMPRAINLQFPMVVNKLFNAFDFVNLTSMNFGSPQCYYRYDYVDVLMLKTLAPLIIVGLLFLVYLFDHRFRTTPLERTVYVLIFFLVTYLVLPRYVASFFLFSFFCFDFFIILCF